MRTADSLQVSFDLSLKADYDVKIKTRMPGRRPFPFNIPMKGILTRELSFKNVGVLLYLGDINIAQALLDRDSSGALLAIAICERQLVKYWGEVETDSPFSPVDEIDFQSSFPINFGSLAELDMFDCTPFSSEEEELLAEAYKEWKIKVADHDLDAYDWDAKIVAQTFSRPLPEGHVISEIQFAGGYALSDGAFIPSSPKRLYAFTASNVKIKGRK